MEIQTISFALFIFVLQYSSSLNESSDDSLPTVSLSDIVASQTEDEVLCVLFVTKNEDNDSVKRFFTKFKQDFEQRLNARYGKYVVRKNDISVEIPTQLPSIKVLSYWSDNYVFAGPWKYSTLRALTNKLLDDHKSRVPFLVKEDDLYQLSETLALIVFIRDGAAVQSVSQEDIKKLREEFPSIGFFIHHIHGNSKDQTGSLLERFLVKESPSAVLFSVQEKKVITKVEGPFKFFQRIEETLITHSSVAVDIVTEGSFHSWLQSEDTSHLHLMCLHAVWAEHNLAFLRTFTSAAELLGSVQSTLKFGYVDVEREREILSKHVHPKYFKKIPCCILLWKEENPEGFAVRQELLEGRPTPWTISDFLKSLNLIMLDYEDNHFNYVPWDTEDTCQSFPEMTIHQPHCFGSSNVSSAAFEDEHRKMTLQHLVTSSSEDDLPDQTYSSSPELRAEANVPKRVVETELHIGNLRQLTDDKWHLVVEQSRIYPIGTSMQFLSEAPWDSSSSNTILVAFIQGACKSCENNMPLFDILSTNLEKLGSGNFYIHNCSSDKISCERQNVRGFPTLIAFRNFGRQSAERCRSDKSSMQYLRMDYHGILTEKLIMEWYLQISAPAVQYATKEDMERSKRVNDVSLHAMLYPSSLAGKYLPTISGPNSWYPYECFRLACDRLYGKAVCYGVISENLKSRDTIGAQEDQDMVVTQIEMYRRDNVSAVVFSLGKALITTLQNEDNIQLHKFHTPHRYNLKSGQRCEDSHSACTDVIVSFVRDHSRLPVTHITAAAFHSQGSLSFGTDHSSSIFSRGMPLLLALATSEQLSENASFSAILQDSAYQFYNQVVFASLNVDEFPQWAARFVPHGYYRHVVENDRLITGDMIPTLFIYPRLCIVTAGNHKKAVFLPKYAGFALGSRTEGRNFTKAAIEDFVSGLLSSPDDHWVETELF